MLRGSVCAGILAASVILAPTADAALLYLGSSDGGLGVYFNADTGLGENGLTNTAYIQAQRDISTDDRGSYFQFDTTPQAILGGQSFNDIFSGQPFGSSQFGFDLLAIMPTYDTVNNNPAIPTFEWADNQSHPGDPAALPALTDVTPGSPGDMAWAINDYNGPGAGVGNPASIVRNSLFRGQTVLVDNADLAPTATGFEIMLSGWLRTDGSIHWSTVGTPDTDLGALGLSDWIYFEGTLAYDLATDTSANLVDFYGGQIDFYFSDTPIPEPATMVLMGLGLAGVAVSRRRKDS